MWQPRVILRIGIKTPFWTYHFRTTELSGRTQRMHGNLEQLKERQRLRPKKGTRGKNFMPPRRNRLLQKENHPFPNSWEWRIMPVTSSSGRGQGALAAKLQKRLLLSQRKAASVTNPTAQQAVSPEDRPRSIREAKAAGQAACQGPQEQSAPF